MCPLHGDTRCSTDRDAHCEMDGSEGSDLDTLQDGIEAIYKSHACMHQHACTAFYKQVAPSDNEEAENSVDVVLKQRAALLTQIHDKASGKQTSR